MALKRLAQGHHHENPNYLFNNAWKSNTRMFCSVLFCSCLGEVTEFGRPSNKPTSSKIKKKKQQQLSIFWHKDSNRKTVLYICTNCCSTSFNTFPNNKTLVLLKVRAFVDER